MRLIKIFLFSWFFYDSICNPFSPVFFFVHVNKITKIYTYPYTFIYCMYSIFGLCCNKRIVNFQFYSPGFYSVNWLKNCLWWIIPNEKYKKKDFCQYLKRIRFIFFYYFMCVHCQHPQRIYHTVIFFFCCSLLFIFCLIELFGVTYLSLNREKIYMQRMVKEIKFETSF